MGMLKQRKNKKFGYEPRHYNNEGKGSPFQMEQKFDRFRTTVGDNKGLKDKFTSVIEELRISSNKKSNKIVLLIISILILVFLYIIDFDLSIFLYN
ncbi:MAG: riboflavin synthase subunit beta [Flavobacteriaceae bacterium]